MLQLEELNTPKGTTLCGFSRASIRPTKRLRRVNVPKGPHALQEST